MAWFVTFYQEIPPGIAPCDHAKYQVGRAYQLDTSDPAEKTPCDPEDLEQGMRRFARDHGVERWDEAAHHYKTSEIDYI